MIGALAGSVKLLVTEVTTTSWSAHMSTESRRAREVDWVSGACLLVRRADAEAAGLFDERVRMRKTSISVRLSRADEGIFTPDAEVVHLRGRSRASAPRATEAAYRRSQLAFYGKHHPRWVPFLRAYLKVRHRLPDTLVDRPN